MNFWRDEVLSELEHTLLTRCLEAHAASVGRENVSSTMLYAAAIGSGDYTKALAGALMTLGGLHAPLVETCEVLEAPELATQLLDMGRKVPGWGHSFAKGGIDPIWVPVANLLQTGFPKYYRAVDEITIILHQRGKQVYPNPSCFTAATGLALHMPKQVIPWIFVHGRLEKWSEIFCQTLKKAA